MRWVARGMSAQVGGRRVLLDWFVSLRAEGVTTVANLAAGILLARALGAEGKGVVALVTTVGAITAAVLGIRWERACGHFLARDGAALPTVFTSVIAISGLAMAGAGLLGAVARALGGSIPGVSPALEPVIVALVGVQVLYVGIASIFGGLRAFATRSRFLLSYNVVQAVTVTVLYALGARHVGQYLVWGVVVSWATVAVWLASVARHHPRVIGVDGGLVRRMVAFSRLSYFGLLLDLVTVRLDIVLLGFMVSPAAAGVYSVAVSVGARLASIPQIVGYVIFHRGSASELGTGERTAQIFRLAVVAMAVAGLAAAVLTSALVVPVYGPDFAQAAPALWIMIPATGLWGLYRLLTSDVEARGRPGLVSCSSLVANVTIVVLDLLWIPRYGVFGAAWASLIAYAVALALAAVLFCRVTGLGLLEAYRYRASDAGAIRKLAGHVACMAGFGIRQQSVEA